ncbi:MAG: glycan-binding surface protein [Rikenellaceae bacterium]|jgi:hypothetical protein|nr:glycan-binding surface protein [Rikenellaceae bacterium]
MKDKSLRTVALLFFAALVFACDKAGDTWLVETTDGPMEVSKVVDPTDYDAPISAAPLEKLIKLVGKNLNNVDTVHINDIGLSIPNDAFTLNGALYLRIPYQVPLVRDDLITLRDRQGRELAVPFVVTLPELQFNIDCEYADAGKELVFSGNYYDLYNIDPDDGVIMFGTVPGEILSMTKTAITVRVPVGVPDNCRITLSSPVLPSPLASSTIFRRTGTANGVWLMADLNGNTQAPYPGSLGKFQDGPEDDGTGNMVGPEAVSGTYVRFYGDYPGGWNGDDWSLVYYVPIAGAIPPDVNTARSNYVIKFEAWAGSELVAKSLRFEFTAALSPECCFWWGNEPTFPLNRWRTVTVDAETGLLTGGNPGGIVTDNFRLILQGSEAGFINCAIDNIRFERK